MGGAAHALALAELVMAERLPVRLHLLIPSVENSVSATAFRPGDVLTSRQGLTVEIENTDAEGRLVLGDALTKAVEDSPELILDFATLTGAARVALGPDLPATFANDEQLAAQLLAAAHKCADPIWRMPLWDGYDEMLKQVPAGRFAEMTRKEPDLPNLEAMAEEHPLSEICSTAGSMGIPLKPQEFQTIVLVKMGHGDLARSLKEDNAVFRSVQRADDYVELDLGRRNEKLASDLLSVIPYRTAFGESFALRKHGLEKIGQKTLPTPFPVTHPLLDKISAAYNGYRQNLLIKISQAAAAVDSDPQLRHAINGRMLIDMFTKMASIPTIDLDSVAYIAGAHMTSSLFGNPEVTMAVASDPWLQSHITAQGF